MTKNLIKKIFFFVITKNLNWVILTFKNLVTFERWDRIKDKMLQKGDLLKRGAQTVCRFKRELGEKDRGGVFEGED